MKCGHQCYGLCGERCPEVCRICNPKEQCFTEDFFYMCELDEDALVYKTKCKHIFSVSGLDNYFNTWGKAQMIKCPKCTQTLIDEPRYQNFIKNIFIDIQKIKKIYLKRNFVSKDGETFYEKSLKIVERILEQYGEIEEKEKKNKNNKLPNFIKRKQYINVFELFNNDQNFLARIEYNSNNLEEKINIIYNLCKKFKSEKNNNKIKKVATYNLLTLAEKFMGIEYYAYIIKAKKKEEEEMLFLYNYEIIKKYFIFDGEFTHDFFKYLKKKINNMLYYAIQKLKKSSLEEFLKVVNDKKSDLMKEIKEKNFMLDINLKDIYENSDIESKEIELVRSLGTTFYKCPKGHLYAVGECGRPMEESKCPDCESKIGGRDHMPASQNTQVNFNISRLHNINDNNNILNQDEEAYENMIDNNNYQMDPEVEEAIRNNPEMGDYY